MTWGVFGLGMFVYISSVVFFAVYVILIIEYIMAYSFSFSFNGCSRMESLGRCVLWIAVS